MTFFVIADGLAKTSRKYQKCIKMFNHFAVAFRSKSAVRFDLDKRFYDVFDPTKDKDLKL